MRRALTVIIAFHWAAILGAGGVLHAGSSMFATAGSSAEIALTSVVIASQILAALAFFWAFVSVLMESDSVAAGQGDVCRIAIGAGLMATTVAALANIGDLASLQVYALQFAGLLISHLIMQSERPLARSRVGANDNSRAAARLLAVLAATDAKIDRLARSGGHGDHLR